MYLHLGGDTVINTENIVGIFDLENTSISKHTKKFLARAEKEGSVINVSYELPKSFIVAHENGEERVYISQLAPSTLFKRMRHPYNESTDVLR